MFCVAAVCTYCGDRIPRHGCGDAKLMAHHVLQKAGDLHGGILCIDEVAAMEVVAVVEGVVGV